MSIPTKLPVTDAQPMNPAGMRALPVWWHALAAYALVGGALSFLGWAANMPRLTNWDGGISIQPNAALAAALAGASLLALARSARRAATMLGSFVALIGISVIVEYIVGVDFGVDAALTFGREWGERGTLARGRMGPPGAISWTLLGLGIVFTAAEGTRSQYRRLVPAFSLATAGLASLSLIGYLYGADNLYSVPALTAIALQASTFVLAVSLGLMLALPDRGPMRFFLQDSAAGLLVRRTVPLIVIVPIVLGLLRIVGDRAGFYDYAFGAAARTLIEIALLLGLLWWTAHTVDDQTRRRGQAERVLEIERQKNEEALREADRRKDEFLVTLAHELRNPLAPVRTAVDLLRGFASNDARVLSARDVIERQIKIMARLLDDLLDIGRIARDKLELRTERIDLAVITHDTIELYRPTIDQFGQQVSVSMPPEPVPLNADPIRIEQVLGNLLNNACKYTPPSGQIRISVGRSEREGWVSVADSGVGFLDDQRPKLFERFSQLDPSFERSRGGLGIGLHLVKRLVEMHGGTIEASSEGPGKGSEFVVRLPLAPEADVTVRSTTRSAGFERVERQRVLVVDDNVDAAWSLATLLELEGHETHTAHDGPAAVRRAEELRPRVILLDLGLPRLNGFEVCRAIREQPWSAGMVIVAVTGWGGEADRTKTRDAGFDHHLVKPVAQADLTRILAQTTAGADVARSS